MHSLYKSLTAIILIVLFALPSQAQIVVHSEQDSQILVQPTTPLPKLNTDSIDIADITKFKERNWEAFTWRQMDFIEKQTELKNAEGINNSYRNYPLDETDEYLRILEYYRDTTPVVLEKQ